MYKSLIRPFFFLFPPESVHRFTVWAVRFACLIPGGRAVLRRMFSCRGQALEKEVFGLRFRNPVGMAPGFDKNGECFRDFAALGFGFIEVGTVTPQPQPGNPRPRLFRLKKDGALINRMGFNNKGLENMICNLRRRKPGLVVGVNLGKNTSTPNEQAAGDYLRSFRGLYDYADYFVVNASCPNVKGVTSLQTREGLMPILDALFDFRRGQNDYRPILVKISPDLTFEQIDEVVDIMIETPLDGIVAVNTTVSREGLETKHKAVEAIGQGGLSGAPLTERALEVVRHINARTKGSYPIIGSGGIMSAEDAGRMLDAGASLVQVYTGFIYEGPGFVRKICRRLKAGLKSGK